MLPGKAIVILINAYTGENTYEISDANTIVNTASIPKPISTTQPVLLHGGSFLTAVEKWVKWTISEKNRHYHQGNFQFWTKRTNGTPWKVSPTENSILEFQ